MATVNNESLIPVERSSRCPIPKVYQPKARASLQHEKLEKTNVASLEDCLLLSSSFQKHFFPVLNLVSANLSTQHTVTSLLDTGSILNLVNCSFSPPSWHRQANSVKSPPLYSAITDGAPVQGVIFPYIYKGDLHAPPGLGIFENVVMDLSWSTSIIGNYIRAVFSTEEKLVPMHCTSGKIHIFTEGLIVPAGDHQRRRKRGRLEKYNSISLSQSVPESVLPYLHFSLTDNSPATWQPPIESLNHMSPELHLVVHQGSFETFPWWQLVGYIATP